MSASQSFLNIVIAKAEAPQELKWPVRWPEMRQHILPCDYPGINFEKMNIYLVEGNNQLLPAMSPQSGNWTRFVTCRKKELS